MSNLFLRIDSNKKKKIIYKVSNGVLGFEGPPGVGKCFAKNTPIMLSNGETKMVQDITLNDKLMGAANQHGTCIPM